MRIYVKMHNKTLRDELGDHANETMQTSSQKIECVIT